MMHIYTAAAALTGNRNMAFDQFALPREQNKVQAYQCALLAFPPPRILWKRAIAEMHDLSLSPLEGVLQA